MASGANDGSEVTQGGREEINLYTREGAFVVSVCPPKFNPKAEVLFWGSRVFVWNGEQYREGMGYYVQGAEVNRFEQEAGAEGEGESGRE